MIEAARIEADEDGWHLVIEGDFDALHGPCVYGSINLRLSDDAAAELVKTVEPIREHIAEGDAVRRERIAAGGGSWEEHRRSIVDPTARTRATTSPPPNSRAADLHYQRGPTC